MSARTPSSALTLHFGQSSALSDFDGDGWIDQALLRDAGQQQSIEVHLSNLKTVSILPFRSGINPFGSLLAEDIDNDGDTDLVWTDLLHPDDVIVWINDGLGRFDRGCPNKYAGRFILGHAAVDNSERLPQPTLIATARYSESERALNQPRHSFEPDGRLAESLHPVYSLGSDKEQPAVRGPPTLFS